MNSLKNSEIRALLEVLTTCNFSLAAEKLGCTQSSLSRIIAMAERRFNASLFHRDTRPVRPTEFGRHLLPLLRNCAAENDNLLSFIEHHNKNPSGNVRIFSPSGLQAFVARNILLPLHTLHPTLTFTMQTVSHTLSDFRYGALFDDECDILISYIQPRDVSLVSRKIVSLDMDIFASDAFYRESPFSSVEELCDREFILLTPLLTQENTNSITLQNTTTGESLSLEVKGQFIFDNAYTAVQLCRSGYGYVLAAPSLVRDIPGIQPRLPDHIKIIQDYFITYRQKAFLPDRVKESIDYIVRFPFREV
ncbi:LysR family transcriptional regulator [Enterobacter hormaechei]|uniref:LysR family transcriptional regulator n=1 Tax=Enterobacter hormaechei TaxID=158836 RepID=UPI0005F8F019|nr:LysR family transcriptional regulator [Enterobacter hormaechei]EKZ5806916.1 LysR family transcriptional regulator [Klebsiella variicola]ELD3473129.1 LysR family transcriptional regulator [Enterobacter hormaechei]ELD3487825.1 LysR family transcriptional regulator [Enterobacter hormaechei]KJX14643.1 hypothetical protein SG64_22700 [Enterobacter hormaechei subsp. xiangfangensis]HCT5211532.1 LysR family transcriptional regulator [Enterobacter hormaechei]